MTLAELRTAVKDAMAEANPTPVSGLLNGEAELDRWIRRAHRWVYNLVARKQPALLLQASPEVPVEAGGENTFPLTLPADLAGNADVDLLTQANGVSIPFSELAEAGVISVHFVAIVSGEKLVRVEAREHGLDRMSNVDVPRLSNETAPYRWFVEGQSIFFDPQPKAPFRACVWFIPHWEPTDAAHVALRGRLVQHHDLIVAKACQLLWRKDEEIRTPWDAEVEDLERELTFALRRTQQQGRRRIGRAGHYPIAGRRS